MDSSSPASEDTGDERRIALRTLLAGLLLLAVAVVLARAGTELIVSASPYMARVQAFSNDERLAECREAFPDIVRSEGENVIVFGSSRVREGFSPGIFDARWKEARGQAIRSWNLGHGGLNPDLQLVLAQLLREAYVDAHQKASLMLIELTPFQATKARRASKEAATAVPVKRALMLTPELFWNAARESPEAAVQILGLRALGGRSPRAINYLLEKGLFDPPAPAWWPGPQKPDPQRERRQLISQVFQAFKRNQGHPPSAWDSSLRGEYRLVIDETQESYAAWARLRAHPKQMERELKWGIENMDLVEERYDDEYIAQFITMVQELKEVSRQTLIFLPPENITWVKNSPAALERRAAVLERISRETGVPIMDFSRSEAFTAEDFLDTVHLSETTGRPKFSALLADAVLARVRDPSAQH